jgi:hypothetical protein
MACRILSKFFKNAGFLVCIFTLSWILIAGLVTSTKPWQSQDDQARYGIYQVSGFYGPGSWGTWLLTVISCLIRRKYATEKPVEEKHAHLGGMDIDIVVAYGYPLIAAMDTLLHLPYYISNDVLEEDLGRLSASLVVARLGAIVGILLPLNRIAKERQRPSAFRESSFCTMGSMLLIVAVETFDLVYKYCNLSMSTFLEVILPIFLEDTFEDTPQGDVRGIKLATLVESSWTSQQRFIYGIPLSQQQLKLSSVFTKGASIVNILITLCYSGLVFLNHLSLRSQNRVPFAMALYILLVFGLSQQIYQAIVEFSIMFVTICLHPSLALPQTSTALSDLDQMSALILGGVLILVKCIWDVYGNTLWTQLPRISIPVWISHYVQIFKGYMVLEHPDFSDVPEYKVSEEELEWDVSDPKGASIRRLLREAGHI